MKLKNLATALLFTSTALSSAYAQMSEPTGAAFTIRATIGGYCDVVAQDMDFGSVDLAQGQDTTSEVTVTCPLGAQAILYMSEGDNSDGAQRYMVNTLYPEEKVSYDLYMDSYVTPYLTSLGESNEGAYHFTGTGAAQSITVYGRIPVQASKPVGEYTDVVWARVSF